MKCNKCGRELRDTSSISQIKNCPFCEVSLNEEKTDVKLDGPGMERIKDLLSQMVKCHPGSFMMGSVAPAGILGKILDFFGCAKKSGQQGNEIKHLVRINKDFYIAKYPVTQIQYKTVMGDNPSDSEGDNKPVDVVNWFMAKEFCDKLNELTKSIRPTDYRFDLPTEAQWEYACRAGTTTSLNSGKDINNKSYICSNLNEVGWYRYNSDGKTHPVGLKKPNAWGIYDMHGNVWEWCRDWYGDYPSDFCNDPEGPSKGSCRVVRGGNYYVNTFDCTSGFREYLDPNEVMAGYGFRLALVQV